MELWLESNTFHFFILFVLKSSVILGFSLILSQVLRKRSAALRHQVLAFSLLGILVLPILMMYFPGWESVAFPKLWEKPIPVVQNQSFDISTMPIDNFQNNPKEIISVEQQQTVKPLSTNLVSNSTQTYSISNFLSRFIELYGVLTLWLLGFFFVLLRTIIGLLGISKLTRHGKIINEYPWQQLIRYFLSKAPIKRKIRLIKNSRVWIPMTCGVIRPVVIIPDESEKWPLEQCSSVLFHELSHIKRKDFLIRVLGRISCALYWFNPLCWIVYRKLKREQEKACDEMVLQTGIKPSTYASHLLLMKKAMEGGHYFPAAALGMAGQSELKERVISILKKQIYPMEVKMRTKMSLLFIIVLVVALIGTAKPVQTASTTTVATTSSSASTVSADKTESTTATATVTSSDNEKKKVVVIATAGEDGKVTCVKAECDDKDKTGDTEKDKKCDQHKVIVLKGSADKNSKGAIVECDGNKIEVKDRTLFVYGKDGKILKKIDLDKAGEKEIKLDGKDGKFIFITKDGDGKHPTWVVKEKGDGAGSHGIWVVKDTKDIKDLDEKELIELKELEKLEKLKGLKDIEVIKEIEKGHQIAEKIRIEHDKEKVQEHIKAMKEALAALEKDRMTMKVELEKAQIAMKDALKKEKIEQQKQELKLLAEKMKEADEARKKSLEIAKAELEKLREEFEKQKEMKIYFTKKAQAEAMKADQERKIVEKIIIDKDMKSGQNASSRSMNITLTRGSKGALKEEELNKMIDELKTNLPKNYSVKYEISDAKIKMTIIAPKDKAASKADDELTMKLVNEFSQKYLGNQDGSEKSEKVEKTVIIKREKEEK